MPENLEKQNRTELQEEFKRAKIIRDIERGLEKLGITLPLETIKAVVDEYQKVTSEEEPPGKEMREMVVDGDMVRSKISDDDDAA